MAAAAVDELFSLDHNGAFKVTDTAECARIITRFEHGQVTLHHV